MKYHVKPWPFEMLFTEKMVKGLFYVTASIPTNLSEGCHESLELRSRVKHKMVESRKLIALEELGLRFNNQNIWLKD